MSKHNQKYDAVFQMQTTGGSGVYMTCQVESCDREEAIDNCLENFALNTNMTFLYKTEIEADD